MTTGTTPRFALTTWSSGDDPFGRAQLQQDNLNVEELGAIFRVGSSSAKPSASLDAYQRTFWYSTDTGVLEYNNGSAWVTVDAKGNSSDPTTLSPGTPSTPEGTSARVARADHSHSVPVASATTITNSNSAGTATTFARSDHNHAIGPGSVTNDNLAGSISRTKISTDVVAIGSSLSFSTASGFSVNVDGSTIEISSNSIRVKDSSIGRAKLATDVVKTNGGLAFSKDDGISVVANPTAAGGGQANIVIGSSGISVNGGISFTSSGVPLTTVNDGNLNVDTTNNLLYFRSGGAWRNALWAAGTANSAPSAKGVWISAGTTPTAGQGAVGDIWITY